MPYSLRTPVYLIANRAYTVYNTSMIKSFKHNGLQSFFETGSKAGIQPSHAPKLSRQLTRLHISNHPQDMNIPGWELHSLTGNLQGYYSISVNGNWRITFKFEGEHAILVDYQDYH